MNDKQEFIDIVETVYRGARKGRGLVVSPKGKLIEKKKFLNFLPKPPFSQLDLSFLTNFSFLLQIILRNIVIRTCITDIVDKICIINHLLLTSLSCNDFESSRLALPLCHLVSQKHRWFFLLLHISNAEKANIHILYLRKRPAQSKENENRALHNR